MNKKPNNNIYSSFFFFFLQIHRLFFDEDTLNVVVKELFISFCFKSLNRLPESLGLSRFSFCHK